MPKFAEHDVYLGDRRYDAPKVTVRRVDLVFGKISGTDSRVVSYFDIDLLSKVDDGRASVIVHCVDHEVYTDGVTWNHSASVATAPDSWCSVCARMKTEHAPLEAKRATSAQTKQDTHKARYPVAQRWNESEAAYAERLAHVKTMVQRSYSQDIDAAIRTLAEQPKATGMEVLAAMINARYGTQERETVEAIVARRERLERQRQIGA